MHNGNEIRTFVYAYVSDLLRTRGWASIEVNDDFDLMEVGLVDSLGYVALVAAIEQRFGVEIDFSAAEPEEMVRVGGLIEVAVQQFVPNS